MAARRCVWAGGGGLWFAQRRDGRGVMTCFASLSADGERKPGDDDWHSVHRRRDDAIPGGQALAISRALGAEAPRS